MNITFIAPPAAGKGALSNMIFEKYGYPHVSIGDLLRNVEDEEIKKELQVMCVLFTEENGGILTLEFDDEGALQFRTQAVEADAMYDDIGAALRIKKLRLEKAELLESLEMFFRVFFLGE